MTRLEDIKPGDTVTWRESSRYGYEPKGHVCSGVVLEVLPRGELRVELSSGPRWTVSAEELVYVEVGTWPFFNGQRP